MVEQKIKFSNVEKEVIFLKAFYDLVNDMVNYEIIELLGNDPHSEIRFKSMTHQKYFNIMLLDFISETNFFGNKLSYQQALQAICLSPNFNINNSINSLNIATNEFSEWLGKEITAEEVWFPSIEVETNLSIKRIEFIKICGNISKHNFTRLQGVTRDLIQIFKRNEIELNEEKALLILEEFYGWFHTHIFSYHSSAIAEFLNNIRWGIYDYLRPEFLRSIIYETNGHLGKYHYTFPKGLVDNFAKVCYWELMNHIRSTPYMRRFQVSRYLKMRH